MNTVDIPIIMPQLGESIAEATIVSYLVREGETVEADQDIIEVETNKANMNVTAPCRGRVTRFTAELNVSYPVGAVLGQVQVSVEEAARLGLDRRPTGGTTGTNQPEASPSPARTGGGRTEVEPTVRGLPVPASASGASYMSPRMKARMSELGLHAADLAGIAGSGAAGRVTIDDLENYLKSLE